MGAMSPRMARNFVSSFAAAVAATLTLNACGQDAGNESANEAASNETANAAAPAAPIAIPSILKTRIYRCRDNNLVYVDFFTDNSAALRTEKTGSPTRLSSGEGGAPPFTAEGYEVSANEQEAEITIPGRGKQSCRASS